MTFDQLQRINSLSVTCDQAHRLERSAERRRKHQCSMTDASGRSTLLNVPKRSSTVEAVLSDNFTPKV